VTARGIRCEPIFFENGDQNIYCDMLAEQMRKAPAVFPPNAFSTLRGLHGS
jgi:hypothetical protein